MNASRVAIYPGTFDPITLGHVDILRRGARLFDRVVVAVADSRRGACYFDLQQRLAFCREALQDEDNVSVETLCGLTVDFAKQFQAHYLLRGLRSAMDFDYELQMAQMNRFMAETLQTVFLPASPECAFISGSMVREILHSGERERLVRFVPECVYQNCR